MDKLKDMMAAAVKAMSAFVIIRNFVKDPSVEAAVKKFMDAIKELEAVAAFHTQKAADQQQVAQAAMTAANAATAEAAKATSIASKIASIVSV